MGRSEELGTGVKNVFLHTSIQLFAADYETGPAMQDDILLNEALADKYGI